MWKKKSWQTNKEITKTQSLAIRCTRFKLITRAGNTKPKLKDLRAVKFHTECDEGL